MHLAPAKLLLYINKLQKTFSHITLFYTIRHENVLMNFPIGLWQRHVNHFLLSWATLRVLQMSHLKITSWLHCGKMVNLKGWIWLLIFSQIVHSSSSVILGTTLPIGNLCFLELLAKCFRDNWKGRMCRIDESAY